MLKIDVIENVSMFTFFDKEEGIIHTFEA